MMRWPVQLLRSAPPTLDGLEPDVRLAQKGDAAAKARIVAKFLPFIQRQAQLYARRAGKPNLAEDLAQAGFCGDANYISGLLRAIQDYRETGIFSSFKRFAVFWINEAFHWTLRVNSAGSRGMFQTDFRIRALRDDLQRFLLREPSGDEIRAQFKTGAPSNERILDAIARETPPREISINAAANFPAREASVTDSDSIENSAELALALGRLPPFDREILRLKFSEGLTDTELGDMLDVSRQRAAQRVKDALRRLKAK